MLSLRVSGRRLILVSLLLLLVLIHRHPVGGSVSGICSDAGGGFAEGAGTAVCAGLCFRNATKNVSDPVCSPRECLPWLVGL
jgi:hypothetical protein